MRIHTNLTAAMINQAARHAQVSFERFDTHRSRTRRFGYDVLLTGSSSRRPNSGHFGAHSDVFAATWDEWGIFLGEIFGLDPIAHCTYYMGADDFHWQTGGRFRTLRWEDQCRDHKWDALGNYRFACGKCDARMQRHKRDAPRLKPTGSGFTTSELVPPRGIQAARAFLAS